MPMLDRLGGGRPRCDHSQHRVDPRACRTAGQVAGARQGERLRPRCRGGRHASRVARCRRPWQPPTSTMRLPFAAPADVADPAVRRAAAIRQPLLAAARPHPDGVLGRRRCNRSVVWRRDSGRVSQRAHQGRCREWVGSAFDSTSGRHSLARCIAAPNVRLEGIYTHIPFSDESRRGMVASTAAGVRRYGACRSRASTASRSTSSKLRRARSSPRHCPTHSTPSHLVTSPSDCIRSPGRVPRIPATAKRSRRSAAARDPHRPPLQRRRSSRDRSGWSRRRCNRRRDPVRNGQRLSPRSCRALPRTCSAADNDARSCRSPPSTRSSISAMSPIPPVGELVTVIGRDGDEEIAVETVAQPTRCAQCCVLDGRAEERPVPLHRARSPRSDSQRCRCHRAAGDRRGRCVSDPDGPHAVDAGDDCRRHRRSRHRLRAPKSLTDVAENRSADRRAAEEHHRLQGQHSTAHRRIGAQLHDRRRRRHERDAGEADEDPDRIGERHVRSDGEQQHRRAEAVRGPRRCGEC